MIYHIFIYIHTNMHTYYFSFYIYIYIYIFKKTLKPPPTATLLYLSLISTRATPSLRLPFSFDFFLFFSFLSFSPLNPLLHLSSFLFLSLFFHFTPELIIFSSSLFWFYFFCFICGGVNVCGFWIWVLQLIDFVQIYKWCLKPLVV